MATNEDSSWELVDGVQRLSTIVKFAGDEDLRSKMGLGECLILEGLNKLTEFDGFTFEELPDTLQLHFETRPLKVITLTDKSDKVVRFDLFERLNTGGVILSSQEIRDCVYRGPFADKLEELSQDKNFRAVVRLTPKQQRDGTWEECVLRFFAFLDQYESFEHSVSGFLNSYMEDATKNFDYESGEKTFRRTFKELAKALPNGIHRPHSHRTTPLNLFEGVAVGAALALTKRAKLHAGGITEWLDSAELRKHTTGATNNPNAVRGRIEYCRDRFLGK